MSYQPNDSRIPVWQIVLGSFIIICFLLYCFFWAQGKVSDDGIYQFVSYGFLLAAFGAGVWAIQYMINTYRARQTKLTSKYRSDEYQKALSKMSRKYKGTRGRFGR